MGGESVRTTQHERRIGEQRILIDRRFVPSLKGLEMKTTSIPSTHVLGYDCAPCGPAAWNCID